jgi:tetratricopeptide (TPR) repeat protein
MLARSGDTSGAMSMGRRAIESAEKIGSVVSRVCAYASNGVACVLGGEWQAARESLEHALEVSRANQNTASFLDAYSVAALAEAFLGLGDEQRASETADEAIQIALRMQSLVGEIRAQLARARVSRALDGVAALRDIESALDRAEALVRRTGARSYEPQILVERARLASLLSDSTQHIRYLTEAHRLFSEMGATGHAERTANRLAEVS